MAQQKSYVAIQFEITSVETGTLIDEAMRTHFVGGPYFTYQEIKNMKLVLEEGATPAILPCRVRNVGLYFFQDASIAWKGFENHVMSRNALAMTGKTLYEDKQDFKLFHYHPFKSFLKEVTKNAVERDERYILKHCFTWPCCREHRLCRRLRDLLHLSKDRESPFCFHCCSQPNCKDFTSREERCKEMKQLDSITLSF